MAAQDEWIKRYLRPMVGGTVKRVGITGDGFPFFVLEKGDASFMVEVSQDEEGNGPGFLFGLPQPAPRAARRE